MGALHTNCTPARPSPCFSIPPDAEAYSSPTSISCPDVATSRSGLMGGEGAAALFPQRGGDGGGLHPLASCLTSFFLGHAPAWGGV